MISGIVLTSKKSEGSAFGAYYHLAGIKNATDASHEKDGVDGYYAGCRAVLDMEDVSWLWITSRIDLTMNLA